MGNNLGAATLAEHSRKSVLYWFATVHYRTADSASYCTTVVEVTGRISDMCDDSTRRHSLVKVKPVEVGCECVATVAETLRHQSEPSPLGTLASTMILQSRQSRDLS